MSTSVIEPGTRLAGRYRLESRVRQSGGSTLWKATDEILARAVAVRTFEPDFPLITEVVMAARSASRLTDPRLTQVFDADDSGELAYVVSEWVVGETLEDMISAGGPMEPGRAATLVGEASEALAAAHLSGLAHLRLTPRDLLWTTGNTVKILGLGVDAALTGTTVEDPARMDTQGLAHLLYLALTAHWAGTAGCTLPAAPQHEGKPYAPRRIQPGVPHNLDQIVCRALTLDGQEPPLTSPAKLTEALSGVPRVPLPLFAGYPQGPPPSLTPAPQSQYQPQTQRTRAMPTAPPSPPPSVRPQPAPSYGNGNGNGQRNGHGAPTTGRRAGHRTDGGTGPAAGKIGKRPLIGIAAALAVLVVGIAGWQLVGGGGGHAPHPKSSVSTTGNTSTPVATEIKLKPVKASGFDAHPEVHGDTTVNKSPGAAIDKSSSSVWETQTYTSPNFGGYKDGLGLLLDMGKSVKVTRVKVEIPGAGGATLQLRLGDGRSLGALHIVGKKSDASGTVELRNGKGISGQYVLLWFTTPTPRGFKAQISDVTVYGQSS